MADLDFDGIDPLVWLDAMPSYSAKTVKEMLQAEQSFEEVAIAWLSGAGPTQNAPFGARTAGQNFFRNVKTEFSKLVCGDLSYETTRRQASKIWRGQKTTIVSTIAVVIAANIGVAEAVLVPVVALLLSSVSQLGVNAWCADAMASGNQGGVPDTGTARRRRARKR